MHYQNGRQKQILIFNYIKMIIYILLLILFCWLFNRNYNNKKGDYYLFISLLIVIILLAEIFETIINFLFNG